jgi:malonate decarboxylase epsilon subunit
MSTALLFPGQGAQSAGYLHRLPAHDAVRSTLEEASRGLDANVLDLDTEEALSGNAAVQIGLLVATVATARALLTEEMPARAVAGLSVGAFAAAVACGSLNFADALRLVRLRGEAMQKAFPAGFGMLAVVGLDEHQVASVLANAPEGAYIAAINAPLQIVLSGSDAALEMAGERARAAGARKTERLAVDVPSHCPLMHDVSASLRQAMSGISLRPPRMTYISNRRGHAVFDAEGIRADLIGNVAHTVRWFDTTHVLYEMGVRLFVELPPGEVLARLAQSAFADARAVSVETAGLEAALLLARREAERDPG